MIFDDSGGPQGGSKIIKNRKKAFQKSIEKKPKKEGNDTRSGASAAALAQPRESKDSVQEGSWQGLKGGLKTPALPAECGGLLFAYARTAALH